MSPAELDRSIDAMEVDHLETGRKLDRIEAMLDKMIQQATQARDGLRATREGQA